jgi:hypothetical protein
VTDLAADIGLSQSCTTRHLQALERRRVVRGARDGKRVLYRIREDDPRLMPLLGWALAAQAESASDRPGDGKPGSDPGPRANQPPFRRRRVSTVAPAPRREDPPPRPAEPPPRRERPGRDSDIEDFLL